MRKNHIEKNLIDNEKVIIFAKINSPLLILPKLIIPIFFMIALFNTDFSDPNIGYQVEILYLIIIVISLLSLIKNNNRCFNY